MLSVKMMKVGQHNPMADGLVGVNSVWSGVGAFVVLAGAGVKQ